MKVYTKTGDNGQTSLIGGRRVNKNDVRLNAYGTVDELNSFIGLLASLLSGEDENKDFLITIQNTLFDLGSTLALDSSDPHAERFGIGFDQEKTTLLEKEIDRLSENLPALKSFVIPGGTQTASLCHICRAVSRRAEREMYTMKEYYPVKEEVLTYINRLSDYFFVLSRYINVDNGNEIFYTKQ